MNLDPENFDIETKKQMGMFPQSDMISRGMIPYAKRIKSDTIAIAVIGDDKGENTVDFLENVAKIVKVNLVVDAVEYDVLQKNLAPFKGKIDFWLTKDKQRDIVCIDRSVCTEENLIKYYENVKHGGIFCGNGHEHVDVKEALTKFRRQSKIGTPIQVSNRSIWFWYVR